MLISPNTELFWKVIYTHTSLYKVKPKYFIHFSVEELRNCLITIGQIRQASNNVDVGKKAIDSSEGSVNCRSNGFTVQHHLNQNIDITWYMFSVP